MFIISARSRRFVLLRTSLTGSWRKYAGRCNKIKINGNKKDVHIYHMLALTLTYDRT